MKKISSKILAGISAFSILLSSALITEKINLNAQESQSLGDDAAQEYKYNPESTALFPKTILDWSPETDSDAIYNVSRVPLASRVQGEPVNEHQSKKAKVMSLAIANKHTAGTPSQGSSDKAVYNFTNWQYVDYLIAWAGSAGEGIIVPPSGDLTDSAHRNGVPVLGTVFFPPEAYGGRSTWVDEFVVKAEDGSFPVADKLIEMANYYGFDGWFINQETNVNQATATALQEFMKYYQENKPEHQHLTWYDSMLPSGSVSWQNQLNDRNAKFFQEGNTKVSDSIFLNFWWNADMLRNSGELAKSLGRSEYEVFAGLDVQEHGTNMRDTPENIYRSGESDAPLSYALYCPDWTLRNGAKHDVEKFQENEQDFWINAADDPRQISATGNWYGMSKYVVEKTPVISYPFITNFNNGVGDNLYSEGKIINPGSFNNRSLQDIMPTYKWIIDNGTGNSLKARFTYEDAFNGGSSVKLSGNMAANSESFIKLYASQLSSDKNLTGEVITKGADKVKLVLDTNEGTLEVEAENSENINSWTRSIFDLSKLKNKVVKSIGLKLAVNEAQEANIFIGKISLIEDGEIKSPNKIENLKVVGKTVQDDLTESARLSWTDAGENAYTYNIYEVNNGEETLLASTSNNAFTLLNQKRNDTDEITYKVYPVNAIGEEAKDKGAEIKYTFNKLNAPDINFNAETTFAKAGDEVRIEAKSSPSTTKIEWVVNGGEIVEQEGNQVVVKYPKAGVYTVIAEASNKVGTNKAEKKNYIYVYDENSDLTVENLALKVNSPDAFSGSSYVNYNEGYSKAFDGIKSTKWCDNSSDQPYIEIDLGAVKTVTGFNLFHAEAGGEGSNMNTKDYDISISLDKKEWHKVVERRDNTAGITSDNIGMTEARYVRLDALRAEQSGNVARIYEFEIMGVDGTGFEVAENAELISELRDKIYEAESKNLSNEVIESAKSVLKSEAATAEELKTEIDKLNSLLGIETGEEPEEVLKGIEKNNVMPFAKWSEADIISQVNDGVVSYDDNPRSRWSDWKRNNQLAENWIALAFGSPVDTREVKLNSLDIDFFYDTGCQLPEEYIVETFVGDSIEPLPEMFSYAEGSVFDNDDNWQEVKYINHPTAVANGTTTVEFEEVTTKAIRIKMKAKAGKSLAVTEITSHGEFIDKSEIAQGMTEAELLDAINSLPNLAERHKEDFRRLIGSKSNENVLKEAQEADARLFKYENMELPSKPEMKELTEPLYGGWFRTWHDKYAEPNSIMPNSFGEIPAEVDMAFVFTDDTKDYSIFWDKLANEYVPKLNKQGTRVLRTITVRDTYFDLSSWAGDFPNTEEGNKERAAFLVYHYVNRFGLDGLDVDIEYHDTVGRSEWNEETMQQSVEVMREMARLLHQNGKLFMIDTNMNPEQPVLTGIYDEADYVLLQAYGRSSDQAALDRQWEGFNKYIEPEKFMLGFSFYEEGDQNGWNDISDQVAGSRAEAYAKWQPQNGKKAGIIGYAIDRDGVRFGDDTIKHTDYSQSKELKRIMLAESGISEVDKSNLEDLINEAELINQDKFTTESLEKLNEALENAKSIFENTESTQEEVESAEVKLTEALEELEEKAPEPTKSTQESLQELWEVINKANEIDTSKYEENSVNLLKQEIVEATEFAMTAMINPNLRTEDIDAVKAKLQARIDGLVELDPDESEVTETTSESSETSETTEPEISEPSETSEPTESEETENTSSEVENTSSTTTEEDPEVTEPSETSEETTSSATSSESKGTSSETPEESSSEKPSEPSQKPTRPTEPTKPTSKPTDPSEDEDNSEELGLAKDSPIKDVKIVDVQGKHAGYFLRIEKVESANKREVYDIKLFDSNGKQVQAQGDITIELSLGIEIEKGEEITLTHVLSNGEKENLSVEMNGNKARFTTSSFSEFIFEAKMAENQTSTSVNPSASSSSSSKANMSKTGETVAYANLPIIMLGVALVIVIVRRKFEENA